MTHLTEAPRNDPSMEARTRMFKTLGCLAVAMTTCTLVLTWMEPRAPISAVLADADLIRERAGTMVRAGGSDASLRSGVVEIVALPGRWSPPRGVAAAREGDVDFVVDHSGVVRVGGEWNRRPSIRNREAPIVVSVDAIAERGEMPLAQWVGLRAVLTALEQRIEGVGGSFSVRIDPSIGAAGSAGFALALRRLLASDGFVSSAP